MSFSLSMAPRIFVEFLPRIQSLSFLVETTDDVGMDADKMTLECDANTLLLSSMERQWSVCALPSDCIRVDCATATFALLPENNSTLGVMCRVKAYWMGAALDAADVVAKPMSASALKAPIRAISCRACASDLIGFIGDCDKPLFDRVMDLPSEYWQELIECWLCHPDQERLAVLSGHKLRPLPRSLLSGPSFFMVDPSYHDDRLVVIDSEVSD